MQIVDLEIFKSFFLSLGKGLFAVYDVILREPVLERLSLVS